MPLQPLADRVLCTFIDTEETYPGCRILLLESSREAQTSEQAEVVAVGPEAHGLNPGDWVIHRPHARVEGPDDKHFWLRADDILCTLAVP